MTSRLPHETSVKAGTFLYAGAIECDVRIVLSRIRYGSGDDEDPPEIANDLDRETYYVWYGSTTHRGVFNAGAGGYPSLAEAMLAAESALGVGSSLRWDEANGS